MIKNISVENNCLGLRLARKEKELFLLNKQSGTNLLPYKNRIKAEICDLKQERVTLYIKPVVNGKAYSRPLIRISKTVVKRER